MGWGEAESKFALERRRAERAEKRADAWKAAAEAFDRVFYLSLDDDATDDDVNDAVDNLNTIRAVAERLDLAEQKTTQPALPIPPERT